jgi:glycosidase
MHEHHFAWLSLPISSEARRAYQVDRLISSPEATRSGLAIRDARLLAQRINGARPVKDRQSRAVSAGQVHAVTQICAVLRFVFDVYLERTSPTSLSRGLALLEHQLGRSETRQLVLAALKGYGERSGDERDTAREGKMPGNSSGPVTEEVAAEALLLIWLANANPAFSPLSDLFDSRYLTEDKHYREGVRLLRRQFESEPPFGPDSESLIEMLRGPVKAFPDSLEGQLRFIYEKWGYLLGDYGLSLLSSLDLLREESKPTWDGSGPSRVYDFRSLELESERFSPDRDWMPNLVLIAKNAYVWLDQLSSKYGRDIACLHEIPDEELDILTHRGFTGLWLIGIWERSHASQRIKQMLGNPEAAASAYSLFDYEIAVDLGGEQSLSDLRGRAWRHGIRLATDMVPNHTGIDSRWIIEHPDWFISLNDSPFPGYSFQGPNLAADQRVGIYLEDHYYDRTDAAVVFKRVDHTAGETRYVYHGNDGTSMPWNDTAQLDYLQPEVREAVTQTILSVARKFPIIRFDAAMTLTRKHFRRLWYPEPGQGGDIPSRSEHTVVPTEFDARMPTEFWRDVVDRVAQEVPDTLLLAEAFWLMEGYFVRTLGMHRVYNSAFMNMLRDEENSKYHTVIRTTLAFDPEILKRFVNFMNNPDERTAVDQFGKDDKYFGICTLMVTMPGLPMFGHGQIEGYTEKYGMEYRRSYLDEQSDPRLVSRHEREIFPLLRRRRLFAAVEHFRLYDFTASDGRVDENVFAYSNRFADERALVVYHNAFSSTRGRIRLSTRLHGRRADGAASQTTLGAELNLHNDSQHYCVFEDHATGLKYIRRSQELHERGLHVELGAYKYHVFLDFEELEDGDQGDYARLETYLSGRGVESISEALEEMRLAPLYEAVRAVAEVGFLNRLLAAAPQDATREIEVGILDEVEHRAATLVSQVGIASKATNDASELARGVRCGISCILQLLGLLASPEVLERTGRKSEACMLDKYSVRWRSALLLTWQFLRPFTLASPGPHVASDLQSAIDPWSLVSIVKEGLLHYGIDEAVADRGIQAMRIASRHDRWLHAASAQGKMDLGGIVKQWLMDDALRQYLRVHQYDGVSYFNKEDFDELLWWMCMSSLTRTCLDSGFSLAHLEPRLSEHLGVLATLRMAAEQAGFQVDLLATTVASSPRSVSSHGE